MKKSFEYWKKLHASEQLEQFSNDREGVLWLKTKSIIRKDILAEFLSQNSIELESTRLGDQFAELFARFAAKPNISNNMLDSFIEAKNKQQIAALDEKQLVSELYKLKSFDWGGDYQNSLDKYLVSRYVKAIQSYDTLISKFDKEIHTAVQGYVLNSWYNHWSSILIEHIFKSHKIVLPTVGQIKYVDFFINNVPFDLKVTYLPAEFVKAERKNRGLPVELTYLKQQARLLGIDFDKNAPPSDIYYEISEKLKDNGSKAAMAVLDKLRNETMTILKEVLDEPKKLAKWLYENQGEMRFGSENRLFLALVDTNDFSGSWKLKRNLDLLKPAIQNYLDNFSKKKISDLKVSFTYKGRTQTFSALTDVLFIVK
ncbi:MAG: hypothetical protein K9N48_00890 [Verrucomicrobia bacterium]|nr:hypothetical protein [Verrucomicrobiota bacterium]MCF7707860.1 hypothetical protein [Verrucomicrobiota bacterium]